ncbi:MAG: pyridoxal phosphate-dependent aminotransferase [Acidobacteria bacterium]|nr:pyridoxal phosphate-dependent aminotransferase [Acidobacteriota bacterium]
MSPRIAQRVLGLKRTLIRELFESAPPDALNLGLGQPDLEPPALLREALARAASEGPSGYGPTAGDGLLRERVAAAYAPFARGPGDAVITVGCQQATFVALGCLVDPGDEVLLPDPAFPGALRATETWGATPRFYPLRAERDFHLDPDEVLSLISPKTRALVVITPSNPTGTVEPAESLNRLTEETARRGIALVIDDTYRSLHWLSDGDAPGAPSAPLAHVVVCGGLSKSVALTGWRLGWVVSPDAEYMARIVALQQTLLTCAPTPTQRAARVAFTAEGRIAAETVRAVFRRRRDLVARILGGRPGLRLAPLEGAFYAWVDASRAGGGMAFARRLMAEDKIVVIPGEAFGRGAPDWLRISYAQDDGPLAAALETIAARLERG